jgi:pimeloyl-ACP methyl ester carboxylesterase
MFWSLLLLSAVLLAAGAAFAAAVVWLMARALLRPPRMTDGKAAWVLRRLSPGDLDLKYEDVTFDVRDGRSGRPLRMTAWWVPHPAARGKCVVLLHGYADAKVGAIAWAPTWHALGFNILAPDLRAHGYSGGEETGAGYYERHDVEQVINQLHASRPEATRQVVLFGASMGATVAAAVAGMDGEAGPDGAPGVAALVLESPYGDFRTAAMAHMDALGAPGPLFQRAALRLAKRVSGANFDEIRMPTLLRRVRCPVMVIAPVDEPFGRPAEIEAMEAALQSNEAAGVSVFWRVEDAHHLTAVTRDPDQYRQRLATFLAQALPATAVEATPATQPAAAAHPAGVSP